MSHKVQCYIGLGSNLEDPRFQVSSALEELNQIPRTRLLEASSLYRSDPVGPQDQPDFINAVALLETELEAHQLLDQLQALEQSHRRVRKQHWGPRTLDLDLLLYGEEQIATERLSVPHPYMQERGFVLWPLAEIAADLILPDGSRLSDLLVVNPMGTLERICI